MQRYLNRNTVTRITALAAMTLMVAGLCGCGQTMHPTASTSSFQDVDSKRVEKVAYYPMIERLLVLTKDGEGYEYNGVPAPVVDDLMSSDSWDAFFQENIERKFKPEQWL